MYELLVQAFDVGFLTRLYSYTFGLPNLTTRLVAGFTRSPAARYESRYGRIPGLLSPAENHAIWVRWFREHPPLGHYLRPEFLNTAAVVEANNLVSSMSAIARKSFIFKNVYFTLCVPALLETFHGSRVIVVERDSKAVAASVYRAREARGARHWWSIRPPFCDDVLRRDLAEQVAFQCIRSQQLLNRDIRGLGSNRCMVVSYRDVCNDPRAFVTRVREWVGSEFSLRASAEVPAHFTTRASKRIPPAAEARFTETSIQLSVDRDRYLESVDEQVRRIISGNPE